MGGSLPTVTVSPTPEFTTGSFILDVALGESPADIPISLNNAKAAYDNGDYIGVGVNLWSAVPLVGFLSKLRYIDDGMDFGKKVPDELFDADAAKLAKDEIRFDEISDGWKGKPDYSHIENPKNLNASTKPTPRQVREMKDANRKHNNGLLRDDKTGEIMIDSKKSKKGVTPPQNEAQVDHMKSVNKGGTRDQSNLELRTRKNNRDKSDK